MVWNFIIYPLHICIFTSIPHHLKKLQFSVKNIQDQRFKMDKTFFFGKKKFSINLFPLKILLLLPNHNSQLSISTKLISDFNCTLSIYRVPISVLLWPNLLHLRYNKHISLIIVTFILNIFFGVCIEAPLENMSISPSIYLSQYQQRQKAIFRNSNTYCTII